MAEVRPDAVVVALAGGRHGVITTAQLAQAGLSKDAIAGRVKRGWLRRRHRGVYVVGPLESPLGFCRPRAGVMHVNRRVAGWEVDFVWGEQHLIVEADGYAFHSSRGSFERDRRKDQELQAAGWRVIRFTWRQITEEPEAVIATLAAALAS